LGYASILKGWSQAEQGQEEQGIDIVRQGLAAQQAAGVGLARSAFLGHLAELQSRAGKPEVGLPLVDQALTFVEKSGERYYEAELYRLKGELLLAQEVKSQPSKAKNQKSENLNPNSQIPGPELGAEAYFCKAINIARHQKAKSWELRASISIVRLWQSQGKQEEAHNLLANIYGWFTEGFETVDLKQARELLASWS
jgi:predicted ATPase